MARIFAELQAIEDGFADADDLYPASQAAAEEMREGIDAEAEQAGAQRGEPQTQQQPGDTPQAPRKPRQKAADEIPAPLRPAEVEVGANSVQQQQEPKDREPPDGDRAPPPRVGPPNPRNQDDGGLKFE
jgi:hypothetical protein